MENDENTNNVVSAGKEPLKAEVATLERVNLATLRNGLCALRDFRLENVADAPLKDVVCEVSSNEGIILPGRMEFDEIAPGEVIERHEDEVLLNQRRILDVTDEPLHGSILMTVKAGGKTLCERRYALTVLPPDRWLGIEPAPELLCAYVMSDDAFVERIKCEAAAFSGGGETQSFGYGGGKKGVRALCATVRDALGSNALRICDDGFQPLTDAGQRLRTPSKISDGGGECSRNEFALLAAAALERCSLHPVLIVTKRGTFVACHLIDTLFEDVVVRRAQAIQKRLELDELVVVCGEGEELAEQLADGSFVCAVDVVRGREAGVNSLLCAEDAANPLCCAGQSRSHRTLTRIERWTQKLLDFSARNRLLNIPRTSRQVVRLMNTDIAALEDKIAANKAIAIQSICDVLGERALEEIQSGRIAPEAWRGAVDAELGRQRLCVAMTPRDVRRRLSDLLHDARTDLEESGVNTLFLTIGELQWMEAGPGAKRKSYRAPILMVPVRLERRSMSEGVRMYRLDEDTVVNTTLVEFMRSQFGVAIPGIEPLPLDESGVDVPRVLGAFREAVASLEGWEVFEDATIGCFSFGKFVMWRDMTERADELRKNPLVNHLIGGGGSFDDGIEVAPADAVARFSSDPGALFCPVNYDSSQLMAVEYSQTGKSFVLHGPPGTGKSQTITNIIAHNLAIGRRVLFVSEKKAALDVVKQRLDRIGLAPYCLELHSNKTEKSRFYAQLKDALDAADAPEPEERDAVQGDAIRCRAQLRGYVEALHRQYPNGLTPYHCLEAAMLASGQDAAHPELIEIDCLAQTREGYRDALLAVQQLQEDFRGVSAQALSSFPNFKAEAWTPDFENGLRSSAERLASAAATAAPAFERAAQMLNCAAPASSGTALATLLDVVAATASANSLSRRFVDSSHRNTPELLKELLDIRERHAKCCDALSSYELGAVRGLDFDGLAARLAENSRKFFVLRFFGERAIAKELSGIVRAGAPRLTAARLADDLPKMRELVSLERAFLDKAGCAVDETTAAPDDFRDAASSAIEHWKEFSAALDAFTQYAADDVRALSPAKLGELCEEIGDEIGELRGVMRCRRSEAKAQATGVGKFAAFIAANDDGNLDVAKTFEAAYAAKMLFAVLATAPELAEFSGTAHDGCVARFRGLVERCAELSRRMVLAKLSAALPRRRSGPCPDGSELGMIKRECEKKTRQKAVRQILAESRTLIPALKPCFLMSPLSVAQYLPVDATPFDLIVFDEASQIPVWDAIGVIARGRQLIVVGDPKQMPPTNFFQKGETDDEDSQDEFIEDQESILDECLVAGVFSTYLNWHYRSRHESLIAFSNEHYYASKLCTFPAASSSPRLGVKFVFVPNGKFTRHGEKGPRVNEAEARALVDYVCAQVLAPGYVRRSIGIVTFSMPQQKLIRALLEERRAENAELERLLPEDGPGAYFVKNLENVQGDESDVILFSVGYAPDEHDRFTMNFGPLNLTGGERRLNVAVTRAREQVVVFSSIYAAQIDAGEDGRTKAVGVGHLKAFLDYAEKATAAAHGGDGGAKGAGEPVRERSFPDVVATFLRGKGYVVDRDVGCSEHRVDIAVRSKDSAGSYIAGIECDGPSYARQRTVQDRDVNRAGVLRGLGWNVIRVWSVDWALDRARAEQRLLDAIAAIADGAAPADAAAPAPAAETPAPQRVASPAAAASSGAAASPAVYKVWKCTTKQSHEAFYEPKSRQKIAKMMAAVIDAEGPVFENTLKKRVARAWGLTRITENVQRVMDSCIPPDYSSTEHETGKVFWPKDAAAKDFAGYRVPAGNDAAAHRALDEIPPEELRNAMRQTLADLGECPKDALYREVIRLFGLATLTSRARRFLDVAYALLNPHHTLQ